MLSTLQVQEAGPFSLSPRTLSLQLAISKEEFLWVQQQLVAHHYLHRRVHPLSRPLAYIVLYQETARVGCLVFNRLQSTRCKGWYGNLHDLQQGWCTRSFWELIGLARVWLDPKIQRDGCWYIPNAASQTVAMALHRIHYDYLLAFPPPYPSEPYELKECVSYCHSNRYTCTLYHASSFTLIRENQKNGLRTYSRRLPGLQPHERKRILEAAQFNAQARRLRQQRVISYTQERLLRKQGQPAA